MARPHVRTSEDGVWCPARYLTTGAGRTLLTFEIVRMSTGDTIAIEANEPPSVTRVPTPSAPPTSIVREEALAIAAALRGMSPGQVAAFEGGTLSRHDGATARYTLHLYRPEALHSFGALDANLIATFLERWAPDIDGWARFVKAELAAAFLADLAPWYTEPGPDADEDAASAWDGPDAP